MPIICEYVGDFYVKVLLFSFTRGVISKHLGKESFSFPALNGFKVNSIVKSYSSCLLGWCSAALMNHTR